jgi:two-component system sensor histidine kinase CssS
MKRMQFSSLGMHIWTLFTTIILIITVTISAVYMLLINSYVEKSKAHQTETKQASSLYTHENENAADKNALGGIEYFIARKSGNEKLTIINPEQYDREGFQRITPELKQVMASFISKGKADTQPFVLNYNNNEYAVNINSIDTAGEEELFIVSYMKANVSNSFLGMAIMISTGIIIIGFFVSGIVAGSISDPLVELEKYTERIANRDWTKPLEIDRKDELGRLAAAMNMMQEALKHKDEDEKLFLQSISHDLRTPVMVISSHAEAIIDGIHVESVAETARVIKAEALRLERKISQILYLNSLDYTLEHFNEADEVNLEELIISITQKMKHIRCDIKWQLNTIELMVRGNQEKLRVAIENIIDNQLRYAKERISIYLGDEADTAVIEIYNDGPSIDSSKIENIFENFYKDKTGNFGLGLAISRKIIEFHGGSIVAANKDVGVSFIIKLPKYMS